jgi:hypothetical protein
MATISGPKMTSASPGIRWRMLANTHPLGEAVLAGILATHIATIFGYWFHGIGLPNLDFPRFNGYLLFRAALGDDPAVVTAVADGLRLILGWIVHSFTGVVWALTYVVAIHPRLGWRNTSNGNLGKAMVWGGVLATLSSLWWVPVLFPEFQLGFFSWNFAGFKGVLAIYVWHAIWALNIGLIYNPLPEDELEAMGAS